MKKVVNLCIIKEQKNIKMWNWEKIRVDKKYN